MQFATCTMWAPACTMDFYRENYLPAIRGGTIKEFTIFTLTDRAEQDDNCANIYHKSLLYLGVARLEKELRKPWFNAADGEPILGMEKFVQKLAERDRPKSGCCRRMPCRRAGPDRHARRPTAASTMTARR